MFGLGAGVGGRGLGVVRLEHASAIQNGEKMIKITCLNYSQLYCLSK